MTLKARFLIFLKYIKERSDLTVPTPVLLKCKLPHNSAIAKDHFAYLGNHSRSQRNTEVDPEVKKLHKLKLSNYVHKR